MAERLHIRPAGTEDAEALAALGERTFRHAFGAQNAARDIDAYVRQSFAIPRMREELACAENRFLLAFLGKRESPVAYAKLRAGRAHESVEGGAPIELQRLYLDAPAKGRGVGSMLMRTCLELAAQEGYRTMWLGVWERNSRAIAFYERWGFTASGEHVFRLGSDDQTDLIMARTCGGGTAVDDRERA